MAPCCGDRAAEKGRDEVLIREPRGPEQWGLYSRLSRAQRPEEEQHLFNGEETLLSQLMVKTGEIQYMEKSILDLELRFSVKAMYLKILDANPILICTLTSNSKI